MKKALINTVCVWAAIATPSLALAAPPVSRSGRASVTSGSAATAPAHAPNPGAVSQQAASDAILADSLGRIYLMADAHFDKGEYNHCINLNQVVVQGDPHNMDAYADNAWLLWSTDRTGLALETLKQGLNANPHSYYMYDELGTFYWLHLHQPATALKWYKQAVKYPSPMLTWHGLAHCYELTGDLKGAEKAWEHASKIKGDAIALVQLRRVRALIIEKESMHI